MKKVKYLAMALCLLIPSFIYAGCSCKSNKPRQLQTPTFVNVMNEVDNFVMYTDANPTNNCSYVFGICEFEDKKDDINNYVRIPSNSPYIDVSHIFTQKKDYWFYAQYIGNDSILDSKISKINTYYNEQFLPAPVLTENNLLIQWQKIDGAKSYAIYNNNQRISQTTDTFFDINTFDNGSLLSQDTLEISVVAIASESTTLSNSKHSISKVIKISKTPLTPIINISNNIVSWNNVENATSYVVKIKSNIVNEFTINSTNPIVSFNLTKFYDIATNSNINLIENIGDYYISVKALNNSLESDFSNDICVTVTEKLLTPTIKAVNLNKSLNQIEIKVVNNNLFDCNCNISLNGNNINFAKDYQTTSGETTIIINANQLNISNISLLTNAQLSIFAKGYGKYVLDSTTTTYTIR